MNTKLRILFCGADRGWLNSTQKNLIFVFNSYSLLILAAIESVYINCDIILTNIASDVSWLTANRFPPPFKGGAPLCLLFALTFNESFIKLIAVHNLANLTKH